MRNIFIIILILALGTSSLFLFSLLYALGGSFSASPNITGQGDARYVAKSGDSETQLFERDANNDITPAAGGTIDAWHQLDANGDIMPKPLFFTQDSNGNIQPVN